MSDTQRFYDVAARTIEGFPAPFRNLAREVVLQVVDWPPQDILQEMQIDDPLDLTGLYDGVPMTEKSPSYPSPYPDTVWLFRRPILAEHDSRGDIDLDDLIAHVTVHEFAHHFGWSDADIATIDKWWE
ncbi:metallopeptidase family protein [Antarctobacter jejuensis]|uniref:metallopeptidase family protein n=1 Tax=Antarctobacter jejuensis TaxID=1439938 RepID=UPI003FD16C90